MSRIGVAQPSTRTLAVRGLIATVLAIAVGSFLVANGAGLFDSGVTVHAEMPAEAGRIPDKTQVYYLGIQVGEVRKAESGEADRSGRAGTRLAMLLDERQAAEIPAGVVLRAVPRTLFGDIRLEFWPPKQSDARGSLRQGDQIVADRSEKAVQLYDVYTRAVALLGAIKPQRLQVTLTALSQALSGRGAVLREAIADADAAGPDMAEATEVLADNSADIADLVQRLDMASPDVIATMAAATDLSQLAVDRPNSLEALLDAGLGVSTAGADSATRMVPEGIQLVRDGNVILNTIDTNPLGVGRTFRELRPVAEKGQLAFHTGRLMITIVPTFADPLPYGPQDCPRYPGLEGSTCRGSARPAEPGLTVSAAAERRALSQLQQAAAGKPGDPVPDTEAPPDTAAWTMLGPLVRGNEVSIR